MKENIIKDFSVDEDSAEALNLLVYFFILGLIILVISLLPINLFIKLGINLVVFVLFFIFLVKYLNESSEKKPTNFIRLNAAGFWFRGQFLFKWDEVTHVDTKEKIKVSGGVLGHDSFLIIRLESGKKIELEINILDVDVHELKAKVINFAKFYGVSS